MFQKQPVLVICQSAVGQMYMGVLLNRIWYSPVLSKTPEEGIWMAEKRPFSLIIFDGDVPAQKLESSVKLLRTDPAVREIPLVVFLTGRHAGAGESLLSQGCSAVFTKPLDLALVYGVLAGLSGQPRHTPRIPVRFRVKVEHGRREQELTCINLSEGGLYLRTHETLPENTRLSLSFILPRDTTEMNLTAEVVRSTPLGIELDGEPGIGLCFVDMPESAKVRIRNFVQWEVTGDLDWQPEI